jgi:outer membrane protein insertion porin family
MKLFFLGNRDFTSKTLLKVISSKERPWYAFIPLFRSPDHNYNPEKIQEDKRLLQEFYQNNGYLDVKIPLAQGELLPLKKYFAVSFSIQEGKKYQFGETTFDSQVKDLDMDMIKKAIPWKKGRWCNQKAVENFCEALPWVIQNHRKGDEITAFYCEPEFKKKEDGTVDIIIHVAEGKSSFAGKVTFEGNRITKEHVIRREMQFSEGDNVNLLKIKGSENALKSLGLFDSVDISNVPGEMPQVEDFIVHIKEKEDVRTITGSAGYSDFDRFTARVEYTDGNFRGEGETVNATALISERNQSLSAFYAMPYFMDRQASVNWGGDLTRQRGDTKGNFERTGSYIELSGGSNAGLRYHLTKNIDQAWDYSIRYADLKARKNSDMNPYIAENIAERKFAVLSTLRHDLTHSMAFPKLGFSRSVAGISTAITGLGGNTSFMSNSIYLNYYVPLPASCQLRFETSYRWKNPWGFMRFNDQIDISGYSFPGFDVGGIGPRDPITGEALFGKQGYVAAAKLDFPIPTPVEMPISGIAFVQSGSVWHSIFTKPRVVKNALTGQVLELPILSQNFFNRVCYRQWMCLENCLCQQPCVHLCAHFFLIQRAPCAEYPIIPFHPPQNQNQLYQCKHPHE